MFVNYNYLLCLYPSTVILMFTKIPIWLLVILLYYRGHENPDGFCGFTPPLWWCWCVKYEGVIWNHPYIWQRCMTKDLFFCQEGTTQSFRIRQSDIALICVRISCTTESFPHFCIGRFAEFVPRCRYYCNTIFIMTVFSFRSSFIYFNVYCVLYTLGEIPVLVIHTIKTHISSIILLVGKHIR